MMGRPHLQLGWLWISRPDWNRTLNQCLRFRDQSNDPTASGAPDAYISWVWQTELPQLAVKYRSQFEARITELQEQHTGVCADIDRGRLDLKPQAEALLQQISQLQEVIA